MRIKKIRAQNYGNFFRFQSFRNVFSLVLLLFTLFIHSCKTNKPIMKTIITSKNAPAPIGPYSHAVLVGNTLYVSGQVGKRADNGELVLSDIKSETKQVMENVKAILTEAGMDFTNVCKTTIFLTDMNNFASVNEVYGLYFSEG